MNRTAIAISRGLSLKVSARSVELGKIVRFAVYTIVLSVLTAVVSAFAQLISSVSDQGDVAAAANLQLRPIASLVWSDTASQDTPKFFYANPMRPYLKRLKDEYRIAPLISKAKSDLARTKIICDWVHQQWEHQGKCPPQPNDPISILEAARKGSKFSCYEYSLVAAGCLSSIGIKSRIVVLLPQDVERNYDGNYHVVAEAYLRDLKKWVVVDAQFNSIPSLNKHPLNLAELQTALAKRLNGLDFGNLKEELKIPYPRDLLPYLHYFYTPYDNRMIEVQAPNRVKGGLMLVPIGEQAPQSFARAPISEFKVTNALPDFYPTP